MVYSGFISKGILPGDGDTDMKIQIALNGLGGELDRQVIDVADDDSAEVSEQIHEAMACWVLSPGDTIVITEAQ